MVWKHHITQEDALAFNSDDDTMEVVQDTIIDNPGDDVIVHPMNPCHYDGLIFAAFVIGKDCLIT